MGFMFWLSSRSSFPGDDFIADYDKLLHAIEYGFLSMLCYRAFFRASRLSGQTVPAWIAGAVLAILYSLTDEFHQSFVPDRSADPLDLVADGVGAFAVGILIPVYLKLTSRQERIADNG